MKSMTLLVFCISLILVGNSKSVQSESPQQDLEKFR